MAKNYIIPILTALIISGIYIIAMIMGGVTLQLQNDAPVLITNDSALSQFYLSLNSSISEATSNTQTANQAFTNSSIQTTGVTPFLSAVGGIWKILTTAPVAIFNVVVNFIFVKIIGNPVGLLFVGAVGSILLMMIISGVIKLVSRGEGD